MDTMLNIVTLAKLSNNRTVSGPVLLNIKGAADPSLTKFFTEKVFGDDLVFL